MTQDNARPLGEWLRQRREELGISLGQAELETRIRRRYLEALENEELDALPDPVVGRGFLRNYADYLNLDGGEANRRYAQVGAAPPPPPPVDDSVFRSEPFQPVPLHEMPGFRVRRGWLFSLAAVVLVAVGLLAWQWWPYVSRLLWDQPRRTPQPTTVLVARQTDLPTATHTARPTTAAPTETQAAVTETAEPTLTLTWTPSPSPTPSPPIYTGIFLEMVFTGTSWIQVTVDGVREFQGELITDTHRSWYGEQRIEVRVGNAGAVAVTLNGQPKGALGAWGEVVDRVFEKVGEEVAAATVTPTSTLEFTPEPSPVPTRPPTAEPTTPITPTATLTSTNP